MPFFLQILKIMFIVLPAWIFMEGLKMLKKVINEKDWWWKVPYVLLMLLILLLIILLLLGYR